MKNFRVVLNFLPVLFLVAATYFFTSGFSVFESPSNTTETKVLNNLTPLESPSTICQFKVHPVFDGGCSCEYMFVCINGSAGYNVPFGVSFIVNVPEGSSVTVCISCGSCQGSIVLTGPGGCSGVIDAFVDLKANEGSCNCSGS